MEHVQSNPSVMTGKPVIARTRIAVENILERLAAGESINRIVFEQPRLTRNAVLKAIEFDAKLRR